MGDLQTGRNPGVRRAGTPLALRVQRRREHRGKFPAAAFRRQQMSISFTAAKLTFAHFP